MADEKKKELTDEQKAAAAHARAVAHASEKTKATEDAAKLRAVEVEASEQAKLAAEESEEERKRRLNREHQSAWRKRMIEGKAAAANAEHLHEQIPRKGEVPDLDNLAFFPAHIAAHAILASIHGDSYDPFHDNEFSRQADGSVRCSIKLKGGGHDRFFVHVPDEVKLAIHTPEKVEMAV